MDLALCEARKAFDSDEVPVGAVIVQDNKVVATAHNIMKGSKNQTNHAEKVAIDKACNFLNSGYLSECDIYISLEPCAMCAAAISFARIRRVYIGALDAKGGHIYNNSKLFYNGGLTHIPEHYWGFRQEESERLMVDFFKGKRSGA
jgi:tRNA(adenine34) deaminase